MRPVLITFSIIGCLAFVAIFYCTGKKQTLLHIVLALLTAGTCGNLYDRVFNEGLVRDFIDVYYEQYHWPIFNLADSAITLGVTLLIIDMIFNDHEQDKIND